MYSDYWRAVFFCKLDSGLEVIIVQSYLYESQAEHCVEHYLPLFKGTALVSKSQDGTFALLVKDCLSAKKIDLILREYTDFSHLPKLTCVTEHVVKKLLSTQYQYVLEFSDGTIWETKGRKQQWTTPWETGSRIIFINGDDKPCLLNIDLG